MANTRLHIPEEELIELYVYQKLSINTISETYNCATNTIKSRLREYNIPIRSKGESLKNNFENRLGVSLTVEKIMEKINEGMFIYEVAEFFGVNRKSITKRLKEAGIELSQHESHQKLMTENNIKQGKERWANNPTLQKKHQEKLEKINKKRSEKAQLGYEMAHLKSYGEYKKACVRLANRFYEKERPEGMQIDHKYSVHDGYLNGIPAPILSHPFNLRLLTAEENNSKGIGSIITLEELYKGAGEPWNSTIKEIKRLAKTCKNCGKEFFYTNQHKHAKFCSKPCSRRYRYKEQVANSKTVNRNCVNCGKSFLIKEIFKTATCGRVCAAKHNYRRRKETSS
ncbi:hypothetical protein CON11_26765 [Priestia megaterium]|uniref:hypothetical protein n=1 Tax=Priestia megaterium TaxID=1404 RepID=UPI000BECE7A7|nr:hypothetical protein [Priestia megaterium]PEC41756.1 hypothetical protein CON11_26765 [Priestia megaterium]